MVGLQVSCEGLFRAVALSHLSAGITMFDLSSLDCAFEEFGSDDEPCGIDAQGNVVVTSLPPAADRARGYAVSCECPRVAVSALMDSHLSAEELDHIRMNVTTGLPNINRSSSYSSSEFWDTVVKD